MRKYSAKTANNGLKKAINIVKSIPNSKPKESNHKTAYIFNIFRKITYIFGTKR